MSHSSERTRFTYQMSTPEHRNEAEFLASHQAIARKISRSFCHDEGDFDDLFQEICIAIWSASGQIPVGVRESTYVYRIALNRAISWHRKRHTYARHLQQYFLDRFRRSPAAVTRNESATDRLYREIRKLSDSERSVILLHLDELSSVEIANVLGIRPASVRKRLSRAKQNLASQLRNQGHEHEL